MWFSSKKQLSQMGWTQLSVLVAILFEKRLLFSTIYIMDVLPSIVWFGRMIHFVFTHILRTIRDFLNCTLPRVHYVVWKCVLFFLFLLSSIRCFFGFLYVNCKETTIPIRSSLSFGFIDRKWMPSRLYPFLFVVPSCHVLCYFRFIIAHSLGQCDPSVHVQFQWSSL